MAPSSSSGSDLTGPRDPGPAARRVTQLPVLQVDEGLGRPCTAGFWNSRIKTQLVQPAAPRPERFDLTSHTGSLMYMAPEVYRKEVYDEKSDVYSFGVILYEVLHKYMMLSAVCTTGTEAEIEAYARSVADGYRPPIHDHWPQPVKDLIRACWAPEPSDRPCMNEVVSRLTAIQDLGGLSTKHQVPGGGQCCVVS
ncbi:Dual specificity protein kinase shkE [Monoraphidium neglectum]|uniref:Dual specificity protein kinase shkE n=1 Tax=Monoraphidium neglectum TaxID=145388 RepID=A0A0D2KKC0_9CHLO|nr:Dual specificity protein kinase shkE [Monoraphidium neglectum]KIY96238.1 Dual specificity protein kinase shkE [Monoraphidium neglectum]|eukprot:XP_013895258.1 Dual specificity protein kinase shkE [Monoraphidium neglectum]